MCHLDGLSTQRGIIINHLKFSNLYIASSMEPKGKNKCEDIVSNDTGAVILTTKGPVGWSSHPTFLSPALGFYMLVPPGV